MVDLAAEVVVVHCKEDAEIVKEVIQRARELLQQVQEADAACTKVKTENKILRDFIMRLAPYPKITIDVVNEELRKAGVDVGTGW